VAEGEPVREGQKLMSIPDLERMQVVIKVHEVFISSVRTKQPALIRVDAFPGQVFRGQVRQIARVASQEDWIRADVKVYPVVVALENKASVLRPGLSTSISLATGKELASALAIPVSAVLHRPALKTRHSCLVLASGRIQEREIVVSLGNETMVEVKSGLKEDEEVIVNPQAVLRSMKDWSDKDKERIKLLRPADRIRSR
jgi:multidrug efflux pump subunit AcrA (membrane-fusion protein)